MLKILFFLFKAALLVTGAVWIADRAGKLTFEWSHVIVEMPAALAVAGVFVFAWLSYQTAKILTALRTTPRLYRMHARLRANRQGQKLLSDALAAFGTQDKRKGLSFLRRAEKLLGTSQVVDFVKAQVGAPLMEGGKAMEAVAENSSPFAWRQVVETRLREGKVDEALSTAQAFAQKFPSLPLAKKLLFDVQVRRRAFDDAATLLEDLRNNAALPRKEWRAAKAALMAERARDSLARGHGTDAFEFAMQADRLAPHWAPALIFASRALALQSKAREAATLIERAWDQAPHEQLGGAYLDLKLHGKTELSKAQAVEKMVKRSRDSFASRLLLARAYMRAGLWGQARLALRGLAEEYPHHDVFELLAKIEEMENGDTEAAGEWRRKAVAAPPDEAWVCSSCHQPHGEWQGSCASCHSFNTLYWKTPLHKGQIEAAQK